MLNIYPAKTIFTTNLCSQFFHRNCWPCKQYGANSSQLQCPPPLLAGGIISWWWCTFYKINVYTIISNSPYYPIWQSKVFFFLTSLIPNLQEAIPASCAHRHAVFGDSQAADAVVVAGQHTGAFSFQGVPHVAVKIVVTG